MPLKAEKWETEKVNMMPACPACAHAVKRVEHLFKETEKLGLDYPTDKMLEDMVRDAEWNALWNPREIAEQHDQDMREMRRIWNMALGANVVEESELIAEREKVNKLGSDLVDCCSEKDALLRTIDRARDKLNTVIFDSNSILSDVNRILMGS